MTLRQTWKRIGRCLWCVCVCVCVRVVCVLCVCCLWRPMRFRRLVAAHIYMNVSYEVHGGRGCHHIVRLPGTYQEAAHVQKPAARMARS